MEKELNRYLFSGLGILVGILLLIFPSILPFSRVLWLLLIIVGVCIVLNNITPLIAGIKGSKLPEGKILIAISIINMLLGIALIFFQNIVVIIITSLLLIVTPIIEIIKSPDQLEKLKEVFFKILVGVLLVIFGPLLLSCADEIGKIICYIAGGSVIILSIVNIVDTLIKQSKAKKDDKLIEADFTEKEN